MHPFQTIIFRFYVNLRGCSSMQESRSRVSVRDNMVQLVTPILSYDALPFNMCGTIKHSVHQMLWLEANWNFCNVNLALNCQKVDLDCWMSLGLARKCWHVKASSSAFFCTVPFTFSSDLGEQKPISEPFSLSTVTFFLGGRSQCLGLVGFQNGNKGQHKKGGQRSGVAGQWSLQFSILFRWLQNSMDGIDGCIPQPSPAKACPGNRGEGTSCSNKTGAG